MEADVLNADGTATVYIMHSWLQTSFGLSLQVTTSWQSFETLVTRKHSLCVKRLGVGRKLNYGKKLAFCSNPQCITFLNSSSDGLELGHRIVSSLTQYI